MFITIRDRKVLVGKPCPPKCVHKVRWDACLDVRMVLFSLLLLLFQHNASAGDPSGVRAPGHSLDCPVDPGVIGNDQMICSGTVPAPILNITSATEPGTITGSIYYKWEYTHDGGVTWNQIPGEHGAGYVPPMLTSETWYRRQAFIVDGAINALCPGVYSNIVKVQMIPNAVGGSVSADQQVCGGLLPADLTLSGNSGAVVRWQRSEDIAFLTPTDINVASTTLPGSSIGPLTKTTWFRAVVDNGACPLVYSGSTAASLHEDFTSWVNPPANSTYGQQANGGSPVNVNGQLIIDGYGGYTFQQYDKGSELEFSAIYDGNTNFSNIGLSATPDFDAPFVSVGRGIGNPAGHVFARVNTGSGPTDVDLGPLAGQLHTFKVIWGSDSFAFYVDGVYVVTIPGSINGPLYQNFYDYPFDGSKLIIDDIRVKTTKYTRVTVDTPSTGGSLSAAQRLCSGATPANIILTGAVGQVLKWQRSADALFTSPVDISVTDTFLTASSMGALADSIWFRAVVQKGSCPIAYSSTTKIVFDMPTVGGAISADQQLCAGSVPADLLLAGETGSIVKWQSATDMAFTTPADIAITSNTLPGTSVGAVVSDTWIRAVVGNGVCAQAFSTPVHLTISTPSAGGVSGADQTICSGSVPLDINISGQTGNVSRWQRSVDAAFTTPVDINNMTPTLTSAEMGPLSTDTWFRAVVQSGVCPVAYSTAVHITVTPVNGGIVTPSGSVCPGANTGSVNLSGSSGAVLNWQFSIDGGVSWADIASTATTYSFTNLTQTTQFRALVQNGTCPVIASSPATILMNPLPLLVVSDLSAAGTPQTADLTAPTVTSGSDPGLSFSYWTDAAATNALATPAAATPGDYYIKAMNGSGCSAIKPVKVNATALPVLLITDPSPVCAPATVDITQGAITAGSTAGLTLSYWQDAAATIPYASPAAATTGMYYIKGTDGYGNQVVQPVQVIVNQPSRSVTAVSICAKDAPYRWNGNDYNASGSYDITLMNSVGCDSIATLDLTIRAASSSVTNLTIATTQLPYTWNGITCAAAGSYLATLTNAAGCDSVANLLLTVLPPATSTSTVAACAAAFPYSWNGNSYAVPGTYTVKLAAADGRDSIATLVLTTVPAPDMTVTGPAPICEGKTAEIILKMQGTAPFTVTYDDGTGVHTQSDMNSNVFVLPVTPSSTSTYRFLTLEDAHCRNDAVSATATVQVIPAEAGQRLPTVNALANVPRHLMARNLGGDYTYQWTPATALSSSTAVDPVFTSSFDQEYRITMRRNTGCGTTDTLLVRVTDMNTPGHEPDIIVPNAFTPNGDGRNDLLSPVPVNLDHLVYFRVFNRWGNLVYECNSSGKGWDGSYHNMPAPSESFTWIAEGVDKNGRTIRRKGLVTVIR